MSLEQDIARVVEASEKLSDVVDTKIEDIDNRVAQKAIEIDQKNAAVESRLTAKEQAVDAKIRDFQKALPLAPNTLVDSKFFNSICEANNTPTDVVTAHKAPWLSFLYDGTEGTGTVTRVSLDKLDEYGLTPNENFLNRGIGYKNHGGEAFYGSNYRVLLFDIEITKGRNSDANNGQFFVLSQGCDTHFGWGRGEFLTQASCWINVLECADTIRFYPSSNRSATIECNQSDLGKGWQYKHAIRSGWGGCHQPLFSGLGKMKVAICLPYVGTGNHGDNMVWADSVGFPYTHTDAAGYVGV
ncbi:hypothetical protein N480_20325 [Pseudoalteromonas luteoviolacea S2607]|uniref:hypothetical protein n=1 Tax=Pseudoalteromonas luteoviolacea TaxID=43657 RepID=UPI0007B0414A|nr:hypothetical protein [Pseudoalteromonas luteoviolacea]KZN34936.1 hypothetical protein N480_20325 [Pseudoalteromonas luteoviolacea S2607]